jgi:hypothetical protein
VSIELIGNGIWEEGRDDIMIIPRCQWTELGGLLVCKAESGYGDMPCIPCHLDTANENPDACMLVVPHSHSPLSTGRVLESLTHISVPDSNR